MTITFMLYLPYVGIFRFSSTVLRCISKRRKYIPTTIYSVQQIKTACQFPGVTLQTYFNSAEPLNCFRHSLCILLRHMPPAMLLEHNRQLLHHAVARCVSETVFNKQKSSCRVMVRFPPNKGHSCIKI